MTEPLVVHRYWFNDERTGIRRLTLQHLSAEQASQRYPGAVPEPTSCERRWLSASADEDQSEVTTTSPPADVS